MKLALCPRPSAGPFLTSQHLEAFGPGCSRLVIVTRQENERPHIGDHLAFLDRDGQMDGVERAKLMLKNQSLRSPQDAPWTELNESDGAIGLAVSVEAIDNDGPVIDPAGACRAAHCPREFDAGNLAHENGVLVLKHESTEFGVIGFVEQVGAHNRACVGEDHPHL